MEEIMKSLRVWFGLLILTLALSSCAVGYYEGPPRPVSPYVSQNICFVDMYTGFSMCGWYDYSTWRYYTGLNLRYSYYQNRHIFWHYGWYTGPRTNIVVNRPPQYKEPPVSMVKGRGATKGGSQGMPSTRTAVPRNGTSATSQTRSAPNIRTEQPLRTAQPRVQTRTQTQTRTPPKVRVAKPRGGGGK